MEDKRLKRIKQKGDQCDALIKVLDVCKTYILIKILLHILQKLSISQRRNLKPFTHTGL